MTEMQSTLTFITESLPAFTMGEPQQVELEVSGGTPPYYFEITQGELPENLTMSVEGTISGTITEIVDNTTVFIKVRDEAGSTLTQAFDVQVFES